MFLQFFLLFGVLDVVYKPLTHILRCSSSLVDKVVEIASGILGDSAKQYTGLREELGVLKAFQTDPSSFANIDGFDTTKISDFLSHFTIFGVDLGTTPTLKPEVWDTSAIILCCIPFLSGILQLIMTIYTQMVQKKRNPAAQQNMGCMNVMLYVMPLFSIWFAFQVSAGVGFYWACSSFFSLIQTVGLNLYFTPERGAKVIEKENKKLEARYAAGKQSFTERLMNQNAGAVRVQETEKTKNMSNRELSGYNKQKLQDARKRMAEKYGDYNEDADSSSKQ
jgi:YidC/Oxa1 family membrane protein insertase